MMYSDYAARLYAAIVTQTLTKGQITKFCSNYRNLCDDRMPRGVAYEDRHKCLDEYKALDNAIETLKPRCTRDHEESGLAFLRDVLLTPNGNIRQTDRAREFRPNDAILVQDCISSGDYQIHLTRTRIAALAPRLFVPVFRLQRTCKWRGLWTMEYAMAPWQATFNSKPYFEIISHV